MIDKHCQSECVVNSYNEWDPLEEVIVGRLEYATHPSWDMIEQFVTPENDPSDSFAAQSGVAPGQQYPKEIVHAAQKSLDEFIHILEAEGVNVRRPDVIDSYLKPFSTPAWNVATGFCSANPRDVFLVVGNEIIEAPMADRSRYFESWAFRTLLKEYFRAGAKWTSAPKPQLLNEQFDPDYQHRPNPQNELRYVTTEFEPTFDAADFVRCGRDIFGQLSHVTNRLGIDWLRRHLGDSYRIHVLENLSPQVLHIDTTFMPLKPGTVMISPDYLDYNKLPGMFKYWNILVAPEPVPYKSRPRTMSNWISINTLMLDHERIIVEKRQEPLIKALKAWGFKPISCSFEDYYPFYGSFHCATLDVRRRGEVQSYF
ncbi:amidinotransferase [candidate division KSB1 bacterium]|nr:amidinotransferase [candidate division KSB1 bacterium]